MTGVVASVARVRALTTGTVASASAAIAAPFILRPRSLSLADLVPSLVLTAAAIVFGVWLFALHGGPDPGGDKRARRARLVAAVTLGVLLGAWGIYALASWVGSNMRV